MKPHLFIVAAVIGWAVASVMGVRRPVQQATTPPYQKAILDTIWELESGRAEYLEPAGPCGELGPYQITHAYWTDALDSQPGLGGSFSKCREAAYSRAVVVAYMERWAPEAWASGDAETILRVHNGGPRGGSKHWTLDYWERGRRILEQ